MLLCMANNLRHVLKNDIEYLFFHLSNKGTKKEQCTLERGNQEEGTRNQKEGLEAGKMTAGYPFKACVSYDLT